MCSWWEHFFFLLAAALSALSVDRHEVEIKKEAEFETGVVWLVGREDIMVKDVKGAEGLQLHLNRTVTVLNL